MNRPGHLCLCDETVPPCGEWKPAAGGWYFVSVRRGQGYWMGDGAVCEVGAGDALVLGPQRRGLFRASQLGEVRLIDFLLCPELLSGLLTLREMRELDRAPEDAEARIRRFPSSHPVAEALASLDSTEALRPGLMSRVRMLQVAAAFFEHPLRQPRQLRGGFLTSHQRLGDLVQQLTEAEVLAHSVAELAARCNCSARHFNRLFTRQVGMSFRAMQAELRLRRARQLLLESKQPVTELAETLGYRSGGLFTAHFKKQFGMSPRAWRERYQSSPSLET